MADPFKKNPQDQLPFSVLGDYNPDKDREWIRGAVTLVSMLIFACVIGLYLFASLRVTDKDQWSRVKEAAEVILPTVTSVLGSALGFYFGSQQKK